MVITVAMRESPRGRQSFIDLVGGPIDERDSTSRTLVEVS